MAWILLQSEEFITVTRDGRDLEMKIAQHSNKSVDGREQLVITQLRLDRHQTLDLIEALQDQLKDM